MTVLLVILGFVVAVLVWVLASPVRMATGLVLVFLTHPTLTVWLTATLAVVLLTVAGVIIWRNVSASGWRLVTAIDTPTPAPAFPESEVDHG